MTEPPRCTRHCTRVPVRGHVEPKLWFCPECGTYIDDPPKTERSPLATERAEIAGGDYSYPMGFIHKTW